MDYSIIILNYNNRNLTINCLDSIKNSNIPKNISYELIIADNNSRPEEKINENIEHNYPNIKILNFNKNLGYAKANNIAAKHAAGKYLIFLNNDVIVDRDWLSALNLSLINQKEPDSVILGPAIYFSKKNNIILSMGGSITPLGTGFDNNFGEICENLPNKERNVGYICGACLLISKNLFLDLNGFDPDYFMYGEDVDLCWRAWIRGTPSVLIPKSSITHFLSGATMGNAPNEISKLTFEDLKYKLNAGKDSQKFKLYFGQKNRLSSIIKNFSVFLLFFTLGLSVIYDSVRILLLLINGSFDSVRALLRGYLSFFKELPKTIKKRLNIQSNRKSSDISLFRSSIIIPPSRVIHEFLRLKKLGLNML